MAWKSPYDYEPLVIAELKIILKQRKLRRGGAKEVLIARLKNYDLEQSA